MKPKRDLRLVDLRRATQCAKRFVHASTAAPNRSFRMTRAPAPIARLLPSAWEIRRRPRAVFRRHTAIVLSQFGSQLERCEKMRIVAALRRKLIPRRRPGRSPRKTSLRGIATGLRDCVGSRSTQSTFPVLQNTVTGDDEWKRVRGAPTEESLSGFDCGLQAAFPFLILVTYSFLRVAGHPPAL